MNKLEQLKNPTSCLNKASPDEPVFVLRAKDPVAAMAVRHWATMAQDEHEMAKIASALKVAEEMEQWRAQNCPKAAPVKVVDSCK